MPKLKKRDNQRSKMTFDVGSDNIFKDLGFPDDEAVNLQLRGSLAIEISNIIEENGWTQRKAARELGVSQPRIAEIMKTKIDHYSIDLLLKYLDKLGRRISFVIKRKDDVA
jgi:predicted XRE-type DNA-binding protein